MSSKIQVTFEATGVTREFRNFGEAREFLEEHGYVAREGGDVVVESESGEEIKFQLESGILEEQLKFELSNSEKY